MQVWIFVSASSLEVWVAALMSRNPLAFSGPSSVASRYADGLLDIAWPGQPAVAAHGAVDGQAADTSELIRAWTRRTYIGDSSPCDAALIGTSGLQSRDELISQVHRDMRVDLSSSLPGVWFCITFRVRISCKNFWPIPTASMDWC